MARRTVRSWAVSSVSSSRGRGSGRPVSSDDRTFLGGRASWRDEMAGEFSGDRAISSPSSSAFRFLDAMLE